MYITIFNRADGKPSEEYPYRTEVEAVKHLNMFRRDNSEIYKNIAVLDDVTKTVVAVLGFINGQPYDVFRNGDVVRLKPEFCGERERHYIYAVTNINDATGRCTITCLNSGMAISPSETVGLEMIRQVANGQPITVEELASFKE